MQFSLAAVRRDGFPFACVLCGNDENPTVMRCKLRKASLVVKLASVFFFFLGPVGWMILAYLWTNNTKETELPVPICDCCSQASQALNRRCLAWLVTGAVLAFSAIYFQMGLDLLLWLAIGFFSLAMIEYFWVGRQFSLVALQIDGDRLLVSVPYEDYPGLYQRHMETVLLYGSNNTLGIEENAS